MTVTQLLDFALPYSAEDNRCGMKRKVKTERRMKLAAKLNDLRNGSIKEISGIEIMVDNATFDKKVAAWIASLKQS
jgi:hypothetical protein